MELTSSDRQNIEQLVERLRLSITQLTVPSEDSRGIQMVRNDLKYVAAELEVMVEESWHLRDDEEDEFVGTYTVTSLPPSPPPEPECEHDKVYAPFLYTGMEPKMPWICSKCLKQGADPGWQIHKENSEQYRKLLNQLINKVTRGEK